MAAMLATLAVLLGISAAGLTAHIARNQAGRLGEAVANEEALAAGQEGQASSALATDGTDHIEINGQTLPYTPSITVAAAAQSVGLEGSPGRLLAVDGTVLDEAGGDPFAATVNGQPAKGDTVLEAGDVVFLEPGGDTTEGTEEITVAAASSVWADDTWGSIHQVVGDEGISEKTVLVGKVSGIELHSEDRSDLGSAHLTKYSIRPEEKVIALTFDDGPWGETTTQLLDLLKELDAHATFFVVGTSFDGDEEASAILKREFDEGHQVCTHTYSHAANAPGFRMTSLSAYGQVQEVKRGQKAIARVTGEPASKVVRMPGGAYDENVAFNVMPFVSYEIGWDIDTQDWRRPGTAAIEEALGKAEPGDVVLMHDGGGDRSQTVEALRNALPRMKEEGWRFVTIDELLSMEDAPRDSAAEAKSLVAIPEAAPEAALADGGTTGAQDQAAAADWGSYEYDANYADQTIDASGYDSWTGTEAATGMGAAAGAEGY